MWKMELCMQLCICLENNTDSGLRMRFYAMKKEVEGLEETMVPAYQMTRCHNPKARSLDNYCRCDLEF